MYEHKSLSDDLKCLVPRRFLGETLQGLVEKVTRKEAKQGRISFAVIESLQDSLLVG